MSSTTVNSLFNSRFFIIPKYQRAYAWETQNIWDLFNDIKESIESRSSHFIGTVVLSKTAKPNTFFVVDGQQRITTLTLIISALVEELSDNDRIFYHRYFIKESDNYRLSPSNRDNQYFINLLNSKVLEPENKSQRLLKNAFEEVQRKIGLIENKLEFLKSISALEMMEFVEDSEGDAIRIFQTVNDRGKLLSNMEKTKSLLIYFSNRYLDKKLDDEINHQFSSIFEWYDDIKHLGQELDINLIKNKDFNEDNIMRYHFITFDSSNYDPSAQYVLQKLKSSLTEFRNQGSNGLYSMENFIFNYVKSLSHFFLSCREIIIRAKTDARYFKIFPVLNLSAVLYPLIIKLAGKGILDEKLSDESGATFVDLVEIIDVRVYKTRGTDPKADLCRFVADIDSKTSVEIENWLKWFNSRWMTKFDFQSALNRGFYPNQALNHIFISYCEFLNEKSFAVEELKKYQEQEPNIEHILSQTPNFSPEALGFTDMQDYLDSEHRLGNLTLLEKRLNSRIQNKNPLEKVPVYLESIISMTRSVASSINDDQTFSKLEIDKRTEQLANYCLSKYWC